MSPIIGVTPPDPREGQRKFSAADGSAALDVLANGQAAGDGEKYKTQSGARSAGQSLQRAVQDAAQARGTGTTAPNTSIRVWKDGDAFQMALIDKDNAPTSVNEGDESIDGDGDEENGGEVPALDSMNREEWNAYASERGVEDPASLQNKAAVREAVAAEQ
jgi:hypothetical protein